MTKAHVVIHRDRTFEFRSRRYRVTQGSDRGTSEWDGYSIVAVLSDVPGDEANIEDGFYSIADVREYLANAVTEKWAYLGDVDGNDPHARQVVTPGLPDLAPLYARHDASEEAWRERRDWQSDPTISGELMSAEYAHFRAQEPVKYSADNPPAMGTIVIDKHGDGWERGRTRWTQISGNEDKFLRVPGTSLWHAYAPYREAGKTVRGGKPTLWRYRLVRPRKPR